MTPFGATFRTALAAAALRPIPRDRWRARSTRATQSDQLRLFDQVATREPAPRADVDGQREDRR